MYHLLRLKIRSTDFRVGVKVYLRAVKLMDLRRP